MDWNEKAGYAFGSVIEQIVTWPMEIFSGVYTFGVRLADTINETPEQQIQLEPDTAEEPGGQMVDTNNTENN